MLLNKATGWFEGVQHCPSPNFNARPTDEVSLLVIHNISLPPGEFGTGQVAALFQNRLDPDAHPFFQSIADLRVSAHFLIDRAGQVTQFVSCYDRAWHAGVSRFGDRENCNDFSLGIELEGTDYEPFTSVQYQTLCSLTQHLQAAFPRLTLERICGHNDIAPGRKTDPGPFFDWPKLKCALGKE